MFTLPALPYARNALSPHISEETLDYHYGKHHQAYVTNLNNLTEGKPLANKSLEEIITTETGGVFNNAAQVWNHTFYWHSMAKNAGKNPHGRVAKLIDEHFGSFESFKDQFSSCLRTIWLWLGMANRRP